VLHSLLLEVGEGETASRPVAGRARQVFHVTLGMGIQADGVVDVTYDGAGHSSSPLLLALATATPGLNRSLVVGGRR
jgi:hypothetical protein